MVLNEKYGVIEFENTAYDNLIDKIVKDIKGESIEDVALPLFSDYGILFAHKEYDFSDAVDWLNKLDVYVSSNDALVDCLGGNALAVNMGKGPLSDYLKVSDKIERTAIFIYRANRSYYFFKGLIHHELAHVFDFFKGQSGNGKDLEAAHMNLNELPDIIDDSSSDEEIRDVLDYCMSYANITEKHAYVETINYDIVRFLTNPGIGQIISKFTKNECFKKSSVYIDDLSFCLCCLTDILNLDRKRLNEFKYRNDYEEIFNMSFFRVVARFKNAISHAYGNTMKLFHWHWENLNINKSLYEAIQSPRQGQRKRRMHCG